MVMLSPAFTTPPLDATLARVLVGSTYLGLSATSSVMSARWPNSNVVESAMPPVLPCVSSEPRPEP